MSAKWPASSPLASKVGRAVKPKDTAWEVSVRSVLHGLGFRFRKHDRSLPGTPDIAFPARKVAVFLDSCFWHACPAHGRVPKANATLWRAKFGCNMERDAKVDEALISLGWRVVRVWSHEADPAAAIVGALGAR